MNDVNIHAIKEQIRITYERDRGGLLRLMDILDKDYESKISQLNDLDASINDPKAIEAEYIPPPNKPSSGVGPTIMNKSALRIDLEKEFNAEFLDEIPNRTADPRRLEQLGDTVELSVEESSPDHPETQLTDQPPRRIRKSDIARHPTDDRTDTRNPAEVLADRDRTPPKDRPTRISNQDEKSDHRLTLLLKAYPSAPIIMKLATSLGTCFSFNQLLQVWESSKIDPTKTFFDPSSPNLDEQKNTIRNTIRELVHLNFLDQETVRNDKGKVTFYQLKTLGKPILENLKRQLKARRQIVPTNNPRHNPKPKRPRPERR